MFRTERKVRLPTEKRLPGRENGECADLSQEAMRPDREGLSDLSVVVHGGVWTVLHRSLLPSQEWRGRGESF